MNKPFYTLVVGDEEYKLCFSSANIVSLEEKLGSGLMTILGDEAEMSKIGVQVVLLHAALQKYEHGISINDTYGIYDSIVQQSEGNGIAGVIDAIVGALRASGFIPEEAEMKKVIVKETITED